MTNKKIVTDILVTGFALFAMFFGAGNLIFPPFLGFNAGANWFVSFICFISIDVGLSLVALVMIAKLGKGAGGITGVLGKKISVFLVVLTSLCLGPLIAAPRTAATTFEFAVLPFLPDANSWLWGGIFFTIVVILSIKQSKVMDIIGAILSPVMFVALMLLICVGIASPLGPIAPAAPLDVVIKDGIVAGYQALDMMGAIVLSVALLSSLNQKGYKEYRVIFNMISLSGVVAGIALFLVYCGLAFLGGSASVVFPADITQSQILIAITKGLLGQPGLILLGLIVAAACLTTAIGLLSAGAQYFSMLTNYKVSYEVFIVCMCLFSYVVSNFGIDMIVAMASPLLELVYPVLIILIIMAIFSDVIKNLLIYRLAAFATFIVSLGTILENYTSLNFGMNMLPLASYGFGWVVPALIAIILATVITGNKAKE